MTQRLPAERMDRRITLQVRGVTRDAATGAEVETWTAEPCKTWAEVAPSTLKPTEDSTLQVASYAALVRIRIRWRAGINRETHRVLHDGELLRIIGVAELGRRDRLELICMEWSHE
jgi:SPP1 family predicted phage head-tail adaptor